MNQIQRRVNVKETQMGTLLCEWPANRLEGLRLMRVSLDEMAMPGAWCTCRGWGPGASKVHCGSIASWSIVERKPPLGWRLCLPTQPAWTDKSMRWWWLGDQRLKWSRTASWTSSKLPWWGRWRLLDSWRSSLRARRQGGGSGRPTIFWCRFSGRYLWPSIFWSVPLTPPPGGF